MTEDDAAYGEMGDRMSHRYLEDITAEAGFEAYGSTKEEMFESAILALSGLMARNVRPRIEKSIEVECLDMKLCLYDLMNELIYLKDTEGFVASEAKVILRNGKLVVNLKGDLVDNAEAGLDVKSCTMHRLDVSHDGQWKCFVVLDV